MILGVYIELHAVQKKFSLYYSVLILETSSLILFFWQGPRLSRWSLLF